MMMQVKLTSFTALLISGAILCLVDSRGIAGNVKLIAMNGNQYWFSSSSPYAPQLNFHLAYQYCRTLGLQLVVLETREEMDTIQSYLNSVEGSSNVRKDFWTSGNKLGADSWIWMSSGEQLNSSFSDYWLQQKQAAQGVPKQCMSMRTVTTTRRAVFSPEECDKSLYFICEQLRCLYYNYPVMQFPDPEAARADAPTDNEGSPTAPSESRGTDEAIRTQHFMSGRNVNSLSAYSDLAKAASSNYIDPNSIQRRITLRPVMTSYPVPASSTFAPVTLPPSSDYVNSFYRYQSINFTATSTSRPNFKKTTRLNLWSPSDKANSNSKPNGENVVYVTSSTLPALPASEFTNLTTSVGDWGSTTVNSNWKLSSSSPAPPVSSSQLPIVIGLSHVKQQPVYYHSKEYKSAEKIRTKDTHAETPVKGRYSSAEVQRNQLKNKYVEVSAKNRQSLPETNSSSEIVTTTMPVDVKVESDTQSRTLALQSSNDITNSTVTDPPGSVVFDDETNNVAAEITDTDPLSSEEEEEEFDDVAEDATTITDQGTTELPPSTLPVVEFALGRYGMAGKPQDTSSIGNKSPESASKEKSGRLDPRKMYDFQRTKSVVAWTSRNSRNYSNQNVTKNLNFVKTPNGGGPAKIGLGPRLNFRRTRN